MFSKIASQLFKSQVKVTVRNLEPVSLKKMFRYLLSKREKNNRYCILKCWNQCFTLWVKEV